MLFSIANTTDTRLDVWWRRDTDTASVHRGTMDPGSEALAVDLDGTAVNLEPGTKVIVRGVAPDGRIAVTTLVVEEEVRNVAELSAERLVEAVPPLTLPEELLLLATDNHGHPHDVGRTSLELGLLTAALLELQLRGRLSIDAAGVHVRDAAPTGDAALDDALEIFSAQQAPKPLIDILTGLVDNLGLHRAHVLEGLVDKGVFSQEHDRLLWLIPRWRYETADDTPENKLIHRLLRVLVLDEPADPRTAALLSIYAICFTSDNFLREQLLEGLPDKLYEVVHTSGETVSLARDAMCGALANAAQLRLPQYGM